MFDTLEEVIEDIENHVVLLPPDPYVSDEVVDGDNIGFGGNLDLPVDVADTFVVHEAESSDSETDEEIDEEPKNKYKNIGLAPYHFCFIIIISMYVNHMQLSYKMITFYLFLSFECLFSV